eukprot:6231191-Amphidinium_carterae.1
MDGCMDGWMDRHLIILRRVVNQHVELFATPSILWPQFCYWGVERLGDMRPNICHGASHMPWTMTSMLPTGGEMSRCSASSTHQRCELASF